MKFEIELINIGREKVCQSYEQEAESLHDMALLVHAKIKNFLVSRNVTMDPIETDETLWAVFAGFRKVGEVRIKEKKEVTI